jgi:hypothetical protein
MKKRRPAIVLARAVPSPPPAKPLSLFRGHEAVQIGGDL